MSYPDNPTPYIEYEPLPSGSLKTPVLTYITRGQRQNSRIFHTKENGKYFEYSVKHVFKNKFSVLCIYRDSPPIPPRGENPVPIFLLNDIHIIPSNRSVLHRCKTT